MDAALRAGIAVYNAGHYHAAHDAWEDEWLDLTEGSRDERLLHGLIQFTAAVHHAHDGNWTGAAGVAESSAGYLGGLPDDYRGVNVAEVRSFLRVLARDPDVVERAAEPLLTYEGDALTFDGLDAPAAVDAAVVVAEHAGYDDAVFEQGAAYARDALADGELDEFGVLLCDFLTERERRPLIATRLRQHVQRRQRRADDVAGLFD